MVESLSEKVQLSYIYPPSIRAERGQPSQSQINNQKGKLIYCVQSNVVIRDVKNPKLCYICSHHKEKTTCAKFSPNGNFVCSGDAKGNIIIWENLPPLFPIKKSFEYPLLGGAVKDIAWTSDGTKIVVAGEGKQSFARVFNWESGNNLGEISGFSKTVSTADFRPIKPFTLALSGEEFSVCYFEGPPYKFKSTQKHHTSFVNCLRYSPDGAIFLTVSSDKSIQQHNGQTGEHIKLFKKDAHQGGITFLDFFKQKPFFATSSLDKTIRIWDFNNEVDYVKELIVNQKPSVDDQLVSVQVNEENVYSFSLQGDLNIWYNVFSDNISNLPIEIYPGHQSPIKIIILVQDQLISGDSMGKILIWKDQRAVQPTGDKHKSTIIGICKCNQRNQAYTLCRGGELKIIDLDSNSFIFSQKFDAKVISFDISHNDELFVLFENNIQIIVGQVKKQELPLQKSGNPSQIAVSQGGWVAVGYESGLINIINLQTQKVQYSFKNGENKITCLKFVNDSNTLVTGDAGHFIKMWDFSETEKSLTEKMGFHTASITNFSISKSGQYMLSCSQDNSFIIWNLSEHTKVLQQKEVHTEGVFACYLDEKGQVFTGGGDCLIKQWETSEKYI